MYFYQQVASKNAGKLFAQEPSKNLSITLKSNRGGNRKRRTFGVLSAYFWRTILPNSQPQLPGKAFTWRGTLAPKAESKGTPAPALIQLRENFANSDSRREQWIGYRHSELCEEKADMCEVEREMSRPKVLTRGYAFSLRNLGSPIGRGKNALMVNNVRPSP